MKQGEFTHPGCPVMSRHNPDHHSRITGNGSGIEYRVGPVGIAAVVGGLSRPVGIHGEKQSREVMRRVRVFPARIQHPAVFKNGGAPIMLLVKTQTPDASPIRIHAEQIGHGGASANTGHSRENGRGVENHSAVGQITGVILVDIRFVRGHLPQPRTIRLEFPDMPPALVIRHGKQHLVGIKVQINIAHKDSV